MRNLISIVVLLLSISSFAETTLRIPVYTEDGTSAVKLNKKLKAKKLELLPVTFDVSSDEENANELLTKLEKQVAAATKALGKESSLQTENIPNGANDGTCYAGQGGKGVVDAVFTLAGSYYTEQMNLWGWKFKKTTVISKDILDAISKEEAEMRLNEGSKEWKSWSGEGDDVLLTLAFSDDGDDVNSAVIPKCEK